MKINIAKIVLISTVFSTIVSAQPLSPNGYSGLGLVPSAITLGRGSAALTYDRSVPGKLINNGYNTQIGFGLTENIELVGRLATNNQKCNLFEAGACPSNTYRDFSSSLKWSLPIELLKRNDAAIAVGATDFGGAASYFRSYYVVGTKTFEQIDLTLGRAKAQVPTAPLEGALASVSWRLTQSSNLSFQRVGQNTSVHALVQVPINENGTNAWITYNRRISDVAEMPKNWIGWGVSMPMDAIQTQKGSVTSVKKAEPIAKKQLSKFDSSNLIEALKEKGFYNAKVGKKTNGKVIVEVENTSYSWNILDAAGVALGVIAGSYDSKEQYFDLLITTRGIRQLKVSGEAKCVGLWLAQGEVCEKLEVLSLGQRSASQGEHFTFKEQTSIDSDEMVSWSPDLKWSLRPEIILSPAIVSAIGTEYGSFDFDMGANINTVIPLWPGATIETNRVEPLGIGTRQFEQGGVFNAASIKAVTNRRLFHQLINLPVVNTQARFSAGMAYSVWDGHQIETSTQSDSGRHKFGLTSGTFKNESLSGRIDRSYNLTNYRYVNNDQQTAVTEVTQGKFWAGDKGFSVNQRFWYGDTTLNVYFRRSRMDASKPLVSFAGLQLAIPFTPRENKSLEHLGFRGVSQWTYSLETKVLEKDNVITGGYGEVPRIGESLVTTFNRDRNSTRYYDTNLQRIRNAYLNLGSN